MKPEDVALLIVGLMALLVLIELVDNVTGGPARRAARKRNPQRYEVHDWKPWWREDQ